MKVRELLESYIGYSSYKHGIALYGKDSGGGARFDDKPKFLKMCLKELRDAKNHTELKHWIKKCREAGYDYPEFKAIEKSLGKINEAIYNKNELAHGTFDAGAALDVWSMTPDHIDIESFLEDDFRGNYQKINLTDKTGIIKYILGILRHHPDNVDKIKHFISAFRKHGYDYPEFRAIEKSLNSQLKEGGPEDGITIYDNEGKDGLVKFKNRQAFIHLCLNELKNGSLGNVRHWIQMARECGYDYPEFKAIEKSLNATIKESESEPKSNAMQTWIWVNNKLKEIYIKYSDQKDLIYHMLLILKGEDDEDPEEVEGNHRFLLNQISMARKAGYDYPEFKTIEKSLNAK